MTLPHKHAIAQRYRTMTELGNIDAMDLTDLEALLAQLTGTTGVDLYARRLFPHRPKGYLKATSLLRRYLEQTIIARKCRLQGAIPAALFYESEAEVAYKQLPTYARW